MRSKTILLALLAFVFEVQAVPVTQTQAENAVSAWVAQGGACGVRLGQSVGASASRLTKGGAAYYVVKMKGGGIVVVSGDTKAEPIVAFTASSEELPDLDEGSPLAALLEADLSQRVPKKVSLMSVSGPTASSGSTASSPSATEAKWAALIKEGETLAARKSSLRLNAAPIGKPGDVRVDKLVQSEWSQAEVGGKKCYNYYTPNNYVCGCVATALAQILRYYHGPVDDGGLGLPLPKNPVEAQTRTCKVDGVKKSLTMQGGTYAWEKMPLKPAKLNGLTEEQRQAIGKLTFDVGVAQCMMYGSGESGAYTPEHAPVLLEVFGYGQAVAFDGETQQLKGATTAVKNALFSNFDAGCPVSLSIQGEGGHSIVADGYGFDKDVAYVHLNMGWAGSCDMWYNLPDLQDIGYRVVDFAVYNLFPTHGKSEAVLSGRVLNEDGKFVNGCPVMIFSADGEVVQTCLSSGRGVWSAVLPAGKYHVKAVSEDGEWCGEEYDISLRAPKPTSASWPNYEIPRVMAASDIGNSWGHDLVLTSPRVRIVVGGETKIYSRLDKALDDAKGLYAQTAPDPVRIELLADVDLRAPVTIEVPCEISSVEGPFQVTRVKDAGFTIAAGGSLRIDRLAFSDSALTLVDVAAGGCFVLGADVGLGLVSTAIPAVRTADAMGLILAAPLQEGFALDCAAAHGAGAVFAQLEGLTAAEAAVAAAKVVNIHDSFGEIRGMVQNGTELVWGEVPVPIEDAVGYYVDNEGVTRTAARHDRLFPKFFAAVNDGTAGSSPELVLIESGSLSNGSFTVVGDCVIRSANDGVVISNSALVAQNQSTTGFNVTKGTLSVTGVTFSGFSGNRPFVTIDGSGAGFVLGREACLVNVAVAGMGDTRGPVTVVNGQCVLAEGSAIVGCQSSSSGGGVCVGAAGALTVSGGVVSNCYAKANGGGVYVAQGASVELSGPSVICCNTSGSTKPYKDDDVYLGQGVLIDLPASVAEGRVGVRSADSAVNKGTSPFAESSLAGLELEMTAKAFFKDGDASKVAVVAANQLKWGEPTVVHEHGPTDDPALAYVQVTYSDGRQELWESTQWLLEALSNSTEAVTIELLRDDVVEAVVPIRAQIRLTSADGVCTLSRVPGAGFQVLEGASLTVADLTLEGVHAADDGPSEIPLIKAVGGEVSLESGATIEGVLGDGNRDAGAVTIWNHGVFRMASGAMIRGCTNMFVDVSVGAGNGGAVLIDNMSTGYLLGGTVTECVANKGGGVSVANQSVVHIGNDMKIDGNFRLSGEPNDLQVHANSSLTLDASLDGKIGYVEGVGGDRVVFGKVSDSFAGKDGDMATSARCFWHNLADDIGAVVTDGAETLLVWSSAVGVEGTVIIDDRTYRIIEGGEPVAVPIPTAEVGLRYQPNVEQTGVLPKMGYELSGNVATLAGSHEAVATLRKGFVWSDGTSDPVTIQWEIAKAVYDMSQVVFESKTVDYDGKLHYLQVPAGVLPDGVKVAYENNNKSAAGVYEVVAKFTGDGDNYEPIPDMTATLTILDQPLPPPPPEPVPCEPFAFTAILNPSEGSWQLTINPAVKYCKYTVLSSDDLKTWEPVIVDEEATADGDKVFTLPANGAQKFWQAVGKDGEKPAEGN